MTSTKQKQKERNQRLDELQTLVGRGDLKLQDRFGKDHVLALLTLEDLADWEKRQGSGEADLSNLENIIYLIWLCVRGEGKKDDEKDRGEWAYTLKSTGRLFTAPQLQSAVETVLEVMVASGWLDPLVLEGKSRGSRSVAPSEEPGPKPPLSSEGGESDSGSSAA